MSDIARVYPAGKEPMFIAGTAAANAAEAGTPEKDTQPKASNRNKDKAVVTDIDR